MADYAQLGTNCNANTNVLVSNNKYLPLNYPEYKLFYTKMYQYPTPFEFTSRYNFEDPFQPENLKTKEQPSKRETYCCGRK